MEEADDAVQDTLEKMYLVWRRLDVRDPMAYARTVLVRSLASTRGRSWWRREHTMSDPPELAAMVDDDVAVDHMVLVATLAGLPTRQRHAVVLRYLEDLPVATVAQLMRCSEGAVKRNAYDGLHALKKRLDNPTRTKP